ncbi:putative vacuolar membrane [Micractinium conductrix]|uniref:Vacuolar membrane n=1 Tax=Micractinium conductrix TaxID=554055 RepID=A0A2P6VAF6_9CHLO|nr:putative vacuolar membrane [Micractinium conductrix]|eukprot:PSC71079.1 putative vacuolar membrane [Micractinium conductrix]
MEAVRRLWERLVLRFGDRRRLLGLAFIVAVALIWVGASFFVQGLEAQGAHPAVLTFVANSLFAIYVPVYFANLRWRRRRAAAAAAAHAQERRALVPAGQLRSDSDQGAEGGVLEAAPELSRPGSPAPEDSGNGKSAAAAAAAAAPPMPLHQLFRAALVVAPLWYLAQFTFNVSLHKTSVTSNTILSSTSSLFTFIFAVWLLAEVFTLWKLGFILLLIAGTAMVTLADGKFSGGDPSAAKQSVVGDLLCLLSAVVYGAYTVAIRKLLREDDDTPMTIFFGFMGMLIFLSVGPLLLLLWLLGANLGIMSWRVFGLMVAKGLADNVLSDYLWARAILLLGPTIATSGLALQVPLAVALDAALRSPAWLSHAGSTVLTLLGGAAVLAGFFGVNAAGEDDEKTRHALWEERQLALQQELDFDLEGPELDADGGLGGGGGSMLAMESQHGSSARHASSPTRARQLDFSGEGGGVGSGSVASGRLANGGSNGNGHAAGQADGRRSPAGLAYSGGSEGELDEDEDAPFTVADLKSA